MRLVYFGNTVIPRRIPLWLGAFAVVLASWISAPKLLSQGGVCAHLVTPSLGVDGGSVLPAGHWSASVAFRYYNSRQDVLGDEPLDHAIVYANTHVYGFDLSAAYAVTDRFDLIFEA